jgi:uncharacterized protein (DUF1330 family)
LATYVVFTQETSHDHQELQTYRTKVKETFVGHPHRLLAAFGAQHVPEGDAPEGTVILEFPSMAAARSWYESPAYQAASRHRVDSGSYRVVFVDGV